MSTQARIGKGLTALLGENTEAENSSGTEIAIDCLSPNPWQPRHRFSEESLKELAASIKNQGIIQPLLVRTLPDERYQIIAGERRWRAAKLAGLTTVPVFVRQLSDEEVMTAALIENLQREDLNPIEEAEALKTLKESLDITQEALAAKIGRSRSSIANALRLLQLSPEAQEDLRTGRLSAGHARTLLAVTDDELAEKLRNYIVQNDLSVREVESIVTQFKEEGRLPWSTEEESLPKKTETKGNRVAATPSELMQKMEEVLSDLFSCKTRVKGTEEKGKIIIQYTSPAELKAILQQVGARGQEEEKY